jgi:hypothetical protein
MAQLRRVNQKTLDGVTVTLHLGFQVYTFKRIGSVCSPVTQVETSWPGGSVYAGGYAAVNTSGPLNQSAPPVDVGE